MLEVGAGFTVIGDAYPQGYSSGGGGSAGAFGGSSQGWTSGSGNHWTPLGSSPAETISEVSQTIKDTASKAAAAAKMGLEGTITVIGVLALLVILLKR